MKNIDLTIIRNRLQPRQPVTAMDELRRRDLADLRMTLWFGSLGGAFGAVAFLIIWWLTRP